MPSRVQDVYNFIVEYKRNHRGRSPSYDEISEGVGLSSKSYIGTYLSSLEKEGKIIVLEGGRGIDVPNSEWKLED